MILPVAVIILTLPSLVLLILAVRLYKLSHQLERIETRLLKAESRMVGNNIEIAHLALKYFKQELQNQSRVGSI